MKIGILIKDFNQLSNWELRIIHYIMESNELSLDLLIKDGRPSSVPKSKLSKLKGVFGKGALGKFIFHGQMSIEKKLFPTGSTVNKQKIINKLNSIKTIELSPKKKGFLDIFSEEDKVKVLEYDLDILLRHEFGIIRGPILTSAKHGIWSFHHGDNMINRGGPPGFWEIVLKQKTVGVTLQQLTPELDGGLVIDKAFFNRHWSYIKTKQIIFESSVSLLQKNIKLFQKGVFDPKKSIVYFNPLYKIPNVSYAIKYCLGFYRNLYIRSLDNLRYKIFGKRRGCWTLFIGKGNFMGSSLFRLKPVKLPKGEFWADPFLIEKDGEHYIFFENYDYKSKKGNISCGVVKGNQLEDIKEVFNFDYHLSYPNIFKEGNDIYMMPESSGNNRLEIYKSTEFPLKWELYATAFEGEKVADAFFHSDNNGDKWLFLNKKPSQNVPMDNELHIFKVDSIQLNEIIPHEKNPVIINSEVARNAGKTFKFNGEIYRPSQSNIHGVYGHSLNINKIKTLNLKEYEEETIISAQPNFMRGLESMHHLHQYGDIFVFDASYKFK